MVIGLLMASAYPYVSGETATGMLGYLVATFMAMAFLCFIVQGTIVPGR